MLWTQKNDYYMESIGNRISATQSVGYSISKSTVYDKDIYELWELPYNSAKLICKGESIKYVKAQAIQHHNAKLASVNMETKGSARELSRGELASADQGALF